MKPRATVYDEAGNPAPGRSASHAELNDADGDT